MKYSFDSFLRIQLTNQLDQQKIRNGAHRKTLQTTRIQSNKYLIGSALNQPRNTRESVQERRYISLAFNRQRDSNSSNKHFCVD